MGEKKQSDQIQLFEDQKIRTAWDAEREEWYFSVVDVVGVLTDSPDYNTGRKYWNKLKQRLKEEGSELVTNCHQLKMTAADGKKRLTDVADTEQLLNMLAEASTTGISRAEQPEGLEENCKVAQRGGRIAGNARKELEQETGAPVITAENAQTLQSLVTGIVEGAAELAQDTKSSPHEDGNTANEG